MSPSLSPLPSRGRLHPTLAATLTPVSPFEWQVRYIRSLFKESLGPELASRLEVNSVDGFQGREKEVSASVSTLRSPDALRMPPAVTR